MAKRAAFGTAKRRGAALLSSGERLRRAAKTLFAERGYEATSTAEIARLAGTSQSQLMKHFGGKQGILEAIFEDAWQQINPAIRLASESVPSPKDKLKFLVEMVLSYLLRDRELRTIFLLEGRRVRDQRHVTVFTPGYLEFVNMMDGIFKEMVEHGQLAPEIHPQALRSALMGAIESMLRDHMLTRVSSLPASYSETDIRTVFWTFLSSCFSK